MYSACDGFKIVDTEGIWVHKTIPANDIKRVIEVMVWVDIVLLLDVEKEVAPLIKGLKINRFPNVSFAKRGMF